MMGQNKKNLLRPMMITIKAVIIKNDGETLLLKRSESEKHNGSRWDLPGGTLEDGETIEESLKREIREETGLEVTIGPILQISEFPKENKNFKDDKWGIRFLTYYQGGKVALDEQEHIDFKWFSLDEAINQLNENDGFEREKRDTLIKAKKYLEMQEAEERWKRALADLDNYKKRSSKEKDEFRKYCLENFISELLPVVDNFEMAVNHVPKKEGNNDWITGILHIKNQLENVLNNEGIEKIDVKPGDKIDEKIHNVISGESKKGKVKEILKAGYRMRDRIIRPASVESE